MYSNYQTAILLKLGQFFFLRRKKAKEIYWILLLPFTLEFLYCDKQEFAMWNAIYTARKCNLQLENKWKTLQAQLGKSCIKHDWLKPQTIDFGQNRDNNGNNETNEWEYERQSLKREISNHLRVSFICKDIWHLVLTFSTNKTDSIYW